MACDTFIKIASKCKRHFVALQPAETEPFIDEIVRTMDKITSDLAPQQVHTFYEACGFMINAQGQKGTQERLIQELMKYPNMAWDNLIEQAHRNAAILEDADTIKVIGNLMKTNVAACSSIGGFFYPQIGRIYNDMLSMYRASSGLIDEAVKTQGMVNRAATGNTDLLGLVATKMPKVRGLRTIKKEILKLISTFVERADDLEMVHNSLLPGLLDAVLGDYRQNVPDAREAEVLSVMTTIITKLHVRWTPSRSQFMVLLAQDSERQWANKFQGTMEDQIPIILDNVFECTLNMINKDFSDYPEQRVQFFNLLRAINLYCFPAMLKLGGRQFKLIIDSCLWASKHDNRDVESSGLNMCIELIANMAETDVQTSNTFFQNFFTNIMQDIFFVLTDSDHKAGFKHQSILLAQMFLLVDTGRIRGPIYGAGDAPTGTSNKEFLAQFVERLLNNAFSNLSSGQIQSFVQKLFAEANNQTQFKLTLRDFLISLREYAGNEDTTDLFAEDREEKAKEFQEHEKQRAMKVGGLIKPSDMDDDEL